MSSYKAPLNDMLFLLEDVFQIDAFWNEIGRPGDVDLHLASSILAEAGKMAEQVLAPLNRDADEQGCLFSDGKVSAPPGFKNAWQIYSKAGWLAIGGSAQYGGMNLPKTLVILVEELTQGSCLAFSLAPLLTPGAALVLNNYADEKLKARYLPKMYSGEWACAMALTEPHAGSDLGMIKTRAQPMEDGTYTISGCKIFITWGEHDMTENIVHLVLAKLPDAPAGSKGLSLFLVPKFIPDLAGKPGARNGVACGAIENKMGIHGSPTSVIHYDAAKGWLIGEAHRGLAAMFEMMNYERLSVGIQGIAVAEASCQNAVSYARERLQGRSPSGPVRPELTADPLIVHPDIRRMLLTMKAFTEGGRAFYLYVARFLDIAHYSQSEKEKQHAEDMAAFLTPIAKAFLTDTGFESTVLGQQVFGGHGYIREWGQEQFVRDMRIAQIYEGTNGIQAIDLISRKTIGTNGFLPNLFVKDIENFIEKARGQNAVAEFIAPLETAVQALRNSIPQILDSAKKDPNYAGTVAVSYLHLCGYVALAYMWARMALPVNNKQHAMHNSKLSTARFYFCWLLPQIKTLTQRLNSTADLVMTLAEQDF